MNLINKLKAKFNKNLIKNNRGQGATEYILLVAVVVGVVAVFGPRIKEKLKTTTDQLGNKMDTVTNEQ